MIGSKYWSTGITVKYGYSGAGEYGWSARLTYLDDGFCSDDPSRGIVATEGTLHTRYFVRDKGGTDGLTVAIDVLKADAERLGIEWRIGPHVYYQGDGEDEDWPPPDGWRETVEAQARRLGWEGLYAEQVPTPAPVPSTPETRSER